MKNNGYFPFPINTLTLSMLNKLYKRAIVTFFTPLTSIVFCLCYKDFHFISNLRFSFYSFSNILLRYNRDTDFFDIVARFLQGDTLAPYLSAETTYFERRYISLKKTALHKQRQ